MSQIQPHSKDSPLSDDKKPILVVITGRSGSGVSTALSALADNGFYTIDNQLVELILPTIDHMEAGRVPHSNGIAIVLDIRNPSSVKKFPKLLKELESRVRLHVLYLTADDSVLATRYGSTRRRHPLLEDGETLSEAIHRESEILEPLQELADVVLDTSVMSPHMLARAMESHFDKNLPKRSLHLTITSFGFKYGHLKQADSIFDLRFIKNPFFVESLKTKTGLEAEVQDYVLDQPEAVEMMERLEGLLRFQIPQVYNEGKHYFRIGVGCSGGRHRSVTFAETLGARLLENPISNIITTIIHRDVDH